MINERTIIDNITILEDGQIQVRRADIVEREGVELARNFHRHVISPGQYLSGEDARVRLVAGVVHTPVVIAAFIEAAEIVLSRMEGK